MGNGMENGNVGMRMGCGRNTDGTRMGKWDTFGSCFDSRMGNWMGNGRGGITTVNVGTMEGTRMGNWMENGRCGMTMANVRDMDGTRMGKGMENGRCGVMRVVNGTKVNGETGRDWDE